MRVVLVKSLCFTKATLCVGKKLTRDKDEHNSLVLADSRLGEQSTDENSRARMQIRKSGKG